MKKYPPSGIYVLLLALLLSIAAGCEVGRQHVVSPPIDLPDTTSTGIQVSVSPADIVVTMGQQQQFQATVTGSGNSACNWTVESGPGTITADGLYTSPASISQDTVQVVIKAVSQAESSAVGRANVHVVKPATVDSTGSDEVCFEREVMPIFASNCAISGCHDAFSAQDGKVFTSYSGIIREIDPGRPDHSEIYEKITEDESDERMPPPPYPRLDARQIATIRKWIEEGAKNTTCTTQVNNCDTANVGFAAVIKPILRDNCVGCHSGQYAPLAIDLSTHAGAKVIADDGRLYGAISHASGFAAMPSGAKKMDDCTIRRIKSWIDKGAPNN